jgi:hypothetical protein
MASNVEWLQKRVEHYRANKNDMCEAIEETKDLEVRSKFYVGRSFRRN